jgi:DNA-binding GntR family transcriptional regulator
VSRSSQLGVSAQCERVEPPCRELVVSRVSELPALGVLAQRERVELLPCRELVVSRVSELPALGVLAQRERVELLPCRELGTWKGKTHRAVASLDRHRHALRHRGCLGHLHQFNI